MTSGTSRLLPTPDARARSPRSVSAQDVLEERVEPAQGGQPVGLQRDDGGGGRRDLGVAEPACVRGGKAAEEQPEAVVAPGEARPGREDQAATVEDQRLGDRDALLAHGRGERSR